MKTRALLLLAGLAGLGGISLAQPGLLTISGPCPAPIGVQGVAYSGFPLTVSGGIPPYTYSNITLPPGLTFNPVTASVGGTPTSSGSFPISIRVTDSNLQFQNTQTYSCPGLTVIPALTITSACPVTATVNAPFSYSATASGGVGPYSFSFASAPPGLTINAGTGLVSGSFGVSGAFSFALRVTDSAQQFQQSKTQTCTFTVSPPPAGRLQITSSCPASPIVQGSSFAQTLTASGGDGNFTWSISTGSLPPGLSLIGNKIGGSAQGPPGTSRFTIQVSSGDQSTTLACSLTVTAARLQLTSGCPTDAVQGVPYTFVLSATAGAGPGTYAFSIVNGSLPAGLSLNGSTISGTPQGPAGSSPFTIQLTSGAETATSSCSMNIAATPLTLAGTCPASAEAGKPVSTTVTATGGQAPYTFSFTGSPWLSLNNGTVSGTPPAEGTGTFTVTVTDAAKAAKSLSCSFPVTAPVLQITGTCPASAVVRNSSVSIPFSATGGRAPYAWTLSGPPWLSLSAATGAATTVTGIPLDAGTFQFTLTLSDGAESRPATFRCSLVVVAALQITTSAGCPSSPLAFQTGVNVALTAAGGAPPYTWSLSGPSWLSLSTATGPAASLTGSASTLGSGSFTVTLSDSANTPAASLSCALLVNLVPAVSITVPATSTSGQDLPIRVGLGSTYQTDIKGTLTLTFTGDGSLPDDPAVQFQNGARSMDVTIPAGSTAQPQVMVKTGTIAGVVTVALALTANGVDVTPPGLAPQRIQIARAVPVLTAVDCVRVSASAFNVIIDGYTNTREAIDATFTFQPATGANLGTTQLQVSATPLFTAWFGNTQNSGRAGGTFRYTQPFNTQGNATDVAAVAVRLTNSIGPSISQSGVACRVQ